MKPDFVVNQIAREHAPARLGPPMPHWGRAGGGRAS